ncbi:M48 family metallopeptidase [Arhodomonas sp. AD133]|uniref:M48 family metallopeptidase n=1 Tax=Arhodomonas sp. AD133 TaxID=3415009 RepID=UPI003EBE88CC
MLFQGWWNDGQSARRLEVRVRLMGGRVVVTDAERDRVIAELAGERLQLAEEVYAGQPLRLKHPDWPDARLTVDDHAFADALGKVAPKVARRFHGKHGTLHRFAVWSGALVVTIALMVGLVQFGAAPLAAVAPLGWEEALGNSVMASASDQLGVCDHDDAEAHLETLAATLASDLDSRYTFRVRILDHDAVNAFATPGGYIAVFDGLIQRASGPNEVAGVLAHEVAHVIERHPTEAMIRRSGYALVISMIVGDVSGLAAVTGDAVRYLANTANSRASEAEADRLAMRMLNDNGFDSSGLVRFFETLEEAHGEMPEALSLLSTHPLTGDRLRDTSALARPGDDALSPRAWADIRSACGDSSPVSGRHQAGT